MFVRGRWTNACKVDGGLLDKLNNTAVEHGTEFDLVGKAFPMDTMSARRLQKVRASRTKAMALWWWLI